MLRHVRQATDVLAPFRDPIGDGHGLARAAGSIGGGLFALVAGFEGVRVGWIVAGVLLVVLLLVSTLEMWTCYAVASEEERKAFDWEARITRKVLRFAVVVLSALCDAAMYTVAHYLPHRFAVLEMGFLFFAITTMLWYVVGDGTRTLLHVAKGHPEEVPPTLFRVLQAAQFVLMDVRRVDQARWKKAGHDGEAPARWTDLLTQVPPEELGRFLEEIRKRSDPPTEPEKLLNQQPGDVT